MKAGTPVKVFAPASVANVAVGYDILGFPLCGIGDDVIVRKGSKPGLHIKTIHKNKNLSKDIHKNTAGYSALKMLQSLGLENEPIEMELFKNMDIGTGLGSSAASSVAGVFAVNEFLGRPLEKKDLLSFATEGERLADGSYHADNVAPCLLGSIILVRDNETLDWVKLPVPIGLRAVIIHPKIKILTQVSRSILNESVSLSLHTAQSANLGAFVAGLYKTDFDLIKRSLNDLIIENQRAALIPKFYDIKEIALKHGALGCSISGAGPSIFCLCNNSIIAENIYNDWSKLYADNSIEHNCFISDINKEGVSAY